MSKIITYTWDQIFPNHKYKKEVKNEQSVKNTTVESTNQDVHRYSKIYRIKN